MVKDELASLSFLTYVAHNGHKPVKFISLVSHEVQVPGKVGKLKRKTKPEVDVEDEKVVDHVGVVAVLRMQVHDPGITLSVKRIVRRRKKHIGSTEVFGAKILYQKGKRKEMATPGGKVEILGAGDFAERRCSRELVVAA